MNRRSPVIKIFFLGDNNLEYIDLQILAGAGHVIHADKPDEFNDLVNEILSKIDSGEIPSTRSKLNNLNKMNELKADNEEEEIKSNNGGIHEENSQIYQINNNRAI